MSFKRFAVLFICASVFTWFVVQADAPVFHLVRQGGTEQINEINHHFFMKWSHGAYFAMDQIAAGPIVFFTVDRDGEWTSTAQFQNPEGIRWYVFEYDRQTDGTIVFSGQTEIGEREEFPFLAWTSADGKIQRMVHTDHYFPYELAVAPDDTIWTLGYEMINLDYKDPAVNQEAHVLRHFDHAGKLIGSAFPQSQFSWHQRYRLVDGLLAATRDRLGWYSPREGSGVYTEISLSTMAMTEYPGASRRSSEWANTESLAMTEDGFAAVGIVDGTPRVRTTYVFDRSSSRWVPANIPPMGGFKFTPILIGSDQDNLVFKHGQESGFFSVSQ